MWVQQFKPTSRELPERGFRLALSSFKARLLLQGSYPALFPRWDVRLQHTLSTMKAALLIALPALCSAFVVPPAAKPSTVRDPYTFSIVHLP